MMPVKLSPRLPYDNAEARIEIIPLIDIMFFLLASFMLISLSMVNLHFIKVNLPPAASPAAVAETRKNLLDVSVDRAGNIYLNKTPTPDGELIRDLTAARLDDPQLRVLITGDRDARHGDVIHALDLVRSAGIDKVAFEIHPTQAVETP
ncbi:MAG: biopolymer transporter ExbD [Tepidisphaeraceae bacterium]|jgi:biopolymer transport protein ExbD